MCANGNLPAHRLHGMRVLSSVHACARTLAFLKQKAREASSWKRQPLVMSHVLPVHQSESALVIRLLAVSSPSLVCARRSEFLKEGAI